MRKALPALLLSLTILSPLQLAANAQEGKGPYSDEIQFIHYLDESVAVQEVKAGNLDLYFFRMPLELVSSAKEDPNVKVYESVGGSLSILVNPAPSTEGLNPFSIKDVRYAMNYLINRALIVNEILKGYGTPMFSAFSVFDPDYLVLIDTVESFGFNYNPQLAEKMITEALSAQGASKNNGKWFFNNKPIEIKFFIRTDDPRRNAVGELISSELERLGFTVVKDLGDLNKAFTVVYGADPILQGWHLYTEGWGGRGGFVRYDTVITSQMYSAWFGNMPGSQIPEFWNYQNATLDEVSQRIFTGNFTSEQERDELLNYAVEMGVQESVRIFITSLVDPYIASKDLEGIVNDFSAGITSRFTLINGRMHDTANIKVGVKQIYQGAWNPIGGFSDVYASRIWLALTDPGTFRHPYTGDVIPVRTSFTVETAGPDGKLDVPQDAIVWDPVSEEWVTVGEGVNATSKVTYDLSYSNWHHGKEMDKNDILYSIYFGFEWGTNEGENDPTFDAEFTGQQEPIVQTLRGYRFLSDNKVESYFDNWHFDKNEIAAYDSVWNTVPWEITAAMEKVVIDGEVAFSKSTADSKKVDWLSLIITSNADKIKKTLMEFKQNNFVPKALKDSVSTSDVIARYDAAIRWIDEKNHSVISNGPFFLQSYNPEARTITIKAFRDNSYPYEIGKWSSFEHARVATISNVNAPLVITKDSNAAIFGGVKLEGDPSKDMKLYYFLKNRDGNVVINGDVSPAADGKFQIGLSKDDTRNLTVGPYELKLLAISNFALKPDIYTTSIIGLAKPLSVPVGASSTSQPNSIVSPSGCLIATAAFGSELSPQVQFLRNFRDDRILSTAAGSSFMNVFNAWYYSFSPYIADYERTNMWFQQIVKTSIYPLIGILLLAETVYASFSGEYGSIIAGLTASTLIGAVYFTPLAMLIRRVKQFRLSLRVALIVFGIVSISLLVGIASNSILLLMASTAAMVLATLIYVALFVARIVEQYVIARIRRISIDDFAKVKI